MSVRRPSRLAAVALAASVLVLGACGGDDDGDAAADAPVAEATTGSDPGSDPGSDTGSDTGSVDNPLGGADVDAALEAAGIEGVADALAFATKAERYEVDGNTVHLYLGEESQLRGETACIAATAVLAEDHKAVIHDEGQEFPC